MSGETLTGHNIVIVESSSPIKISQRKNSSWKWWQHKSPDSTNFSQDYASSVAPSSLVVHHSICSSRESEDIYSTTSVKSRPFVSKRIAHSNHLVPYEGEEHMCDGDLDTIGQKGLDIGAAIATPGLESVSCQTALQEPVNVEDTPTTPSSSILNRVHSLTSSTVPVKDFQVGRRKSSENILFSGIKAKFGKWINNSKAGKD